MATAGTAQDPLTAATEAYRQGDLAQAARLFSQAAEAEQSPAARAQIRVKLAWTYHAQKNRTRAEEALAAALADDPALELDRDFYTDDFLALAERIRKRQASATAAAVRPSPTPSRAAPATTPGAMAQLRQRLAQATDPPALESVLAEIANLEMLVAAPQLSEVLEVKAEVLDRLGRTGDALELRGRLAALRATSQAAPGTSAVPLDALLEARRLLAAGRPEDAASLLRGVLAAQPAAVPALEVLAEALVEAGRLDEAFAAVRTALQSQEKPELLLMLGEIELRRERLTFARDAFRKVVELDAGNDRGWAALGLLAARSGDVATAREALDRALRANVMLFEARVVRAQIALLDGQPQVAIQSLQRAVQQKPDDPWPQAWLGMAFLSAGNHTGAVDRLDPAVKAGLQLFALPLAEALRRQGSIEKALQILDRMSPQDPRVGEIRDRCLLDARRPGDAARLLEELSEAEPDRGDLIYLRALALHASAQWAESTALFERAEALAGAPTDVGKARLHAEATQRAQELLDRAQTPPPPPPKR